MARIRTVKPEMCADEDLASCSIEAQLLAVRILNHADDEGYFKAHSALVKAACFPLIDSVNVPVALRELSSVGYLRLETGTDGKEYGQIVNFLRHQTINKPRASKIKALFPVPETSGSPTVARPEGYREEWNGTGNGTGNGKDLLGDESPGEKSATPEDQDFERLWLARPPRAGNDPKLDAQKAFTARMREGESLAVIEAGLKRYVHFCTATGKNDTEKVLRLSTFLGPAKPYTQAWTLPKVGAAQQSATSPTRSLKDQNYGVSGAI